jgi:type VI secretion system secreted protein Hcp
LAYSFGVSAGSTGSFSGGLASNASFSDLRIIKVLDTSSPVLFQDAASGQVITTGTLELVRPDGQDFMDYKLSNVLVSGVQDLGSGNDETTDQQVTLRFSKIEWEYTPYDETGQPGDTVTASWDLGANRTSSGATPPAVDVGNASGQAFVAYLKLDGVSGESQDANHPGWIEVLAYSFGVSPGSTGGGSRGSASNVSFSDLQIIKVLDKSSPILLVDEASAKIISTGTLELVRPDGQVFMDYKLANVIVSSVQELGSGSDRTTDEQITLRFSKIEWDYTPYDATGQAGTTVTTSWDRLTNQASLPGTPPGTSPSTSLGISPSTSPSNSPSTSPALVSTRTGGAASKKRRHEPASVGSGFRRARPTPHAKKHSARLRRRHTP